MLSVFLILRCQISRISLIVVTDLFLPKNDLQGRLKACQEELLMELHNHIDQVLCLWVASFVPHTLLKNESI